MFSTNRRRLLLAGGAVVGGAALPRVPLAQTPGLGDIKIGTVLPARTGLSTVRTSINDYPGEGARQGSLLAEGTVGEAAAQVGVRLDVLMANSPTPEAAARAARRLIALEAPAAIVGGVGDGQAEILSALAEDARIPFFNIGSPSLSLRRTCRRYTFHVEASAAMYLDALAIFGAASGYRRWYIVREDNDEGNQIEARAIAAIERQGGAPAGISIVVPEQPQYIREVNAIGRASADVVLLAINGIDQIALLNFAETLGVDVPFLTLPDLISQTRDYLAAARFQAAVNNPRTRVTLWDSTLTENGAREFNTRFMSRFSEAVDPTAWAAYQSIAILWDAIQAVGTTDSETLVEYLEAPDTTFDVLKGPGVSFRAWDHQLRQPVYELRVDQEVEWIRTDLSTRVGIASAVGELPPRQPGEDTGARLDELGDGPEAAGCNL